ncbi:Gfo/Idh/MocA family protein [Occultella aeris]|uniref:4-carboxy-2-hydroxymuconate-6-semialdehyde dehydrogenase n=1 Tax=Occultella aeris TaxID=2761496 RepID=A0A7M4DFI0_9MICO|nr:Gfo/Idh/MocA family oxidoreductase [Occultella aeris]VZO35673.1 4-carboxy-2-hydroxymuconate-6-semialdehyde dehydrogenase [Occultella aeris]
MISVGLVGAGAIAERHAAALRDVGARVAAVADPEAARAAALAGGSAAVFSTADELFAHPGLDAAVIASPNDLHATQTIAALRAGLHVLTEIPVGVCLAEANAVAVAATQAGRYAAVAHTLRFCRPYLALKARIDAGELDARHLIARTLIHRQHNTGMDGRIRAWTDDVRWHHGAHTVDAALWLLSAETATAHGLLGAPWPTSGRPMDAGLVLETPDGVLVTIALSYHSRLSSRELIAIGENDTLRIDGGVLASTDHVVVDAGGEALMEQQALVRQDEDFVRALADGRRPACVIDDVLPAMRVLDAFGSQDRAGATR